MKFFVFLLAVLFGVWLWRRNRLNALKEKQQNQQNKSASQSTSKNNGNGSGQASGTDGLQHPSPMHACDHCGVHLPESDMVTGRSGRYCSEVHRQAAGDQPA